MFYFCTLWKHKTSGFQRFSGSIGMLHWREWDISPSASILWESQFMLWESRSFLLRSRVTQKSLQLHFFFSHMRVTQKALQLPFWFLCLRVTQKALQLPFFVFSLSPSHQCFWARFFSVFDGLLLNVVVTSILGHTGMKVFDKCSINLKFRVWEHYLSYALEKLSGPIQSQISNESVIPHL